MSNMSDGPANEPRVTAYPLLETAREGAMNDLGDFRREHLSLEGRKTRVDLQALEAAKRAHQVGTTEWAALQAHKAQISAWKTSVLKADEEGDHHDDDVDMGFGQSHRQNLITALRNNHRPDSKHLHRSNPRQVFVGPSKAFQSPFLPQIHESKALHPKTAYGIHKNYKDKNTGLATDLPWRQKALRHLRESSITREQYSPRLSISDPRSVKDLSFPVTANQAPVVRLPLVAPAPRLDPPPPVSQWQHVPFHARPVTQRKRVARTGAAQTTFKLADPSQFMQAANEVLQTRIKAATPSKNPIAKEPETTPTRPQPVLTPESTPVMGTLLDFDDGGGEAAGVPGRASYDIKTIMKLFDIESEDDLFGLSSVFPSALDEESIDDYPPSQASEGNDSDSTPVPGTPVSGNRDRVFYKSLLDASPELGPVPTGDHFESSNPQLERSGKEPTAAQLITTHAHSEMAASQCGSDTASAVHDLSGMDLAAQESDSELAGLSAKFAAIKLQREPPRKKIDNPFRESDDECPTPTPALHRSATPEPPSKPDSTKLPWKNGLEHSIHSNSSPTKAKPQEATLTPKTEIEAVKKPSEAVPVKREPKGLDEPRRPPPPQNGRPETIRYDASELKVIGQSLSASKYAPKLENIPEREPVASAAAPKPEPARKKVMPLPRVFAGGLEKSRWA